MSLAAHRAPGAGEWDKARPQGGDSGGERCGAGLGAAAQRGWPAFCTHWETWQHDSLSPPNSPRNRGVLLQRKARGEAEQEDQGGQCFASPLALLVTEGVCRRLSATAKHPPHPAPRQPPTAFQAADAPGLLSPSTLHASGSSHLFC